MSVPPARIAAPPAGRKNSTANAIYRELRADIMSMRRRPGDQVSEKDIAVAHGVSRTPVREALLRLADERLIDIRPQSGTFVARIPLTALPEAILVRKALEEVTVKLAAEQADAAAIRRLQDIVERQRRMARRGDRERFHEADDTFHLTIAEIAGHAGIWRLIEQVKVQVDRYRRLTLPVPGRMEQVIDEHCTIVAAIAAHDPARAGACMLEHLERLRASIGDVRDLNPDFFGDADAQEAP